MAKAWSRVISASKPAVFGDGSSTSGVLELQACSLLSASEGAYAAGCGPSIYCSAGRTGARFALARLTEAAPFSKLRMRLSGQEGAYTLSVSGAGKVRVTGVLESRSVSEGVEAAPETVQADVDSATQVAKAKLETVRRQIAALEAQKASAVPRQPTKKRAREASQRGQMEALSSESRRAAVDLGLSRPQAVKKAKTVVEIEHKSELTTSSTGLGIRITRPGKGQPAKTGDVLHVRYDGTLAKSGKRFDKGMIKFRLGAGKVIRGWDEGFQGMLAGEKRTLLVPASLGYGAKGAPPDIPRNADLVFQVELTGILK